VVIARQEQMMKMNMKKTTATNNDQTVFGMLAIALCTLALWAVGCGGGGGNGGTPTGPSGGGGNAATTITITANGLSDATPRVSMGDRIRFTNNDSRAHQILTTPHLLHTDCPALNSVGSLAPGQSGVSEPLTSTGGCGFHDHLNPDDNKYRGQVLVGLAASDPVPPAPSYIR
jgi:plastocyanin